MSLLNNVNVNNANQVIVAVKEPFRVSNLKSNVNARDIELTDCVQYLKADKPAYAPLDFAGPLQGQCKFLGQEQLFHGQDIDEQVRYGMQLDKPAPASPEDVSVRQGQDRLAAGQNLFLAEQAVFSVWLNEANAMDADNTLPTTTLTPNEGSMHMNIVMPGDTSSFANHPPPGPEEKRKLKSLPASERLEYGLPRVHLSERELMQIREGYHLEGMKLRSFKALAPSDILTQREDRVRYVRITLAEFDALKQLRVQNGQRPPFLRGTGPTQQQREIASRRYEAKLKEKAERLMRAAAYMAAQGSQN